MRSVIGGTAGQTADMPAVRTCPNTVPKEVHIVNPNDPRLVSTVLASCLDDGDVDGLERLYEPAALFADVDGFARGWPAIRYAHQQFVDEGLVLTLEDAVAFEVGDIALVQWSWVVRRGDDDPLSGASAEVLRRQPDGSWKFLIDNSDGAALIELARPVD